MLVRHPRTTRRLFSVALVAVIWGTAGSSARAGITFNFTTTTIAADSDADKGFRAAAARWSSLFDNTFTLNLTVNFSSFGMGNAGIIGQAGSTTSSYNYTQVRNALVTSANSTSDAAAIASLPTTTSFSLLTNYTSDNPNGAGSTTAYVDSGTTGNNARVSMTTGNAKALGLLGATNADIDAEIDFNSDFSFDFDPGDGITGGRTDFVGVATHEIGHALGFISGVDNLDTSSGTSAADSFRLTTMDLFRYSSASRDSGGIMDFTAGTADKYFSLDNGITSIASFSTGRILGDGRQASHWKDSPSGTTPIGIMDPTAAPNELLSISATDRQLFDVIGYRITGAEVPEPSALALFAGGALPLGILYRRRKRRIA